MKNKNLHNINKTGFKSPKNYFESFEDTLMNKINNNQSLNDINETGFELPNNYFENFEGKLHKRISKENEPKAVRLFTRRNLVYLSGVAAAILILFNLSIFDKEITWDSLDAQTVENYIIGEDFDSYELASLLPDDQLLESNFISNTISDDTLENYLIDNLDLEDIIIE
jgi:hypothetical protein